MNIPRLLGDHLKSDDIIELLEHLEADVIYDFDRLHKGEPDCYRVSAHSAGIELLFDDSQTLETIFLRVLPSSNFQPFDFGDSDIHLLLTIEDAQKFALRNHLPVTNGHATFDGVARNWIKLDFASHTAHYEYIDGHLNMVTLGRSLGSL